MLHPRTWLDDRSVDECCRCATAFSFLRRRHHCRHCGGVFCGPCTEQRLWLRPWPGAAPQRNALRGTRRRDDVPAATRVSGAETSARTAHNTVGNADVPSASGNASSGSTSGGGGGGLAEAAGSRTCASVHDSPRQKKCDQAEQSRTSAVGMTSSSTEADSRGEDAEALAGERSAEGLLRVPSPAQMPHCYVSNVHDNPSAVGGAVPTATTTTATTTTATMTTYASNAGLGSRQVSDAVFSSSVYAVSPTTAGGEATPQAWATPAPVPGLDRTSFAQTHGQSISISSGEGLSDLSQQQQQQRSTVGTVSTITTSGATSATLQHSRGFDNGSPHGNAALSSHPVARGAAEQAVYVAASYRVEVDARNVTWYLCRVCRTCYDSLLDTILDAHEHDTPHSSPYASTTTTTTTISTTVNATSALVPALWQYVRLSGSGRARPPAPTLQQSPSPLSQSMPATPGATPVPTHAKASPRLSASWSRLRHAVSLPASPLTAFLRASPTNSSSTNTAEAAERGGGAAPVEEGSVVLPPPALRPRDLRQARDISSPVTARISGAASRSAHGTVSAAASQAKKGMAPAMGVPGLPARLYGPAASSAVAASPTRQNAPCESALLSVSSASFQPLSRQSTEVTSPKLSQQPPPQQLSRLARVNVTPPRRRLISIENTIGHIRQAVAIARRRRRIAIILIDEREPADVVEGGLPDRNGLQRSVRQPQRTGSSASARRSRQANTTAATAAAAAAAITAPQSDLAASAALTFSPYGSPMSPNAKVADFRSAGEGSERLSTPGAVQSPKPPIATPVGAPLPENANGQPVRDDEEVAEGSALPDRHSSPAFDSPTVANARLSQSGSRPNLSILVDSDDDAENAASGPPECCCALPGRSLSDWLLPTLPPEAAAAVTAGGNRGNLHNNNNNSFSTYALERGNDVPSTPCEAAFGAPTSRPISCAGSGGGPPSTPKHTATGSATAGHGSPHQQQQQQQQQQHRHPSLPALALVPECGTCVLAALLSELGATTQRSSNATTPGYNALTPTSAAAAAACGGGLFPFLSGSSSAGAGAAYVDPVIAGVVSQAGWGTGPESYAAQRQALVREMVLRQQRAMAAAAAAAPTTSPQLSPSSSNYGSGGAFSTNLSAAGMAFNNLSGPTTSGAVFSAAAAAAAASATTPRVAALSAHERVTAPVNIFFQLRSSTDTGSSTPTSASGGGAAGTTATAPPLSISILPVTTQVEVVGVPLDVSAAPVNTSPKSTLTPTNAFTSPRTSAMSHTNCTFNSTTGGVGTGGGSSSGAGVAGVSRPYTLSEFLPQLAKLSTNLDGYLVVVLRCGSRRRRTTSAANVSPTLNASSAEESPHASTTAARRARRYSMSSVATTPTAAVAVDGTDALTSPGLSKTYDGRAARGLRTRLEGESNVCEDAEAGGACLLSAPLHLPTPSAPRTATTAAPQVHLSHSISVGGGGDGADGTRDRSHAHPHRRCRVTDPFGGPQLRLLHQQLQGCGITQPAISVVDVCEDPVADVERSPASTASYGSPFGERSFTQGDNNNTAAAAVPTSSSHLHNVSSHTARQQQQQQQSASAASPTDAWTASPASPTVASPLSSRSSSVRLLIPTGQRVSAATAEHTTPSHGPEQRPAPLDTLMLPSSLHSTREPVPVTTTTPSDLFSSPTAAATKSSRRELHRLAAQEHAMTSLRAAAHQLGLPVSTMTYPSPPSATATANSSVVGTMGSAGGTTTESPLRSSCVGAGGGASSAKAVKNGSGGGALLARGLESLAATMVYRDLSAQQ